MSFSQDCISPSLSIMGQKVKHFIKYYNNIMTNETFVNEYSSNDNVDIRNFENAIIMNNKSTNNYVNKYEVFFNLNKEIKTKNDKNNNKLQNIILKNVVKKGKNAPKKNKILQQDKISNKKPSQNEKKQIPPQNNYHHPNLEKLVKLLYHTLKERNSDFTDRKNLQHHLSNFNIQMFSKYFNFENQPHKRNKSCFQIKSYFDGKPKDNLPYITPAITTYYNDYSSKSERERHIKMLKDLAKLKECIDRNQRDSEDYFKDFLLKYHINDIDQYSKEQLWNLIKINNFNNKLIDPSKNTKQNIKNVLESTEELTKIANEEQNKYISPILDIKKAKTFKKESIEPQAFCGKTNLYFQHKLYAKDKDYAENPDRIVDDIGEEIKQFKDEQDKEYYKLNNHFNSTKSFSFLTLLNRQKKDSKSNKLSKIKEDERKFSFRLASKKDLKDFPFSEKISMNNSFYNSNNISKEGESPSINEINQRLYYKRIAKPNEMDIFRKKNKLTEYIAFNSARNNLFINRQKQKFDIV